MIALSSIMITLLVAQADAAAPSRQAQSQAVDPEQPAIQVGLFSYRPDGSLQGFAVDSSLSPESFQYVSGCGIGSGNRPVPDDVTDAWRISGRVLSISAEEAVIKLDWQRIRAGGVAVSSPGASVQLTLRSGDRVPLDSVNVDGSERCPSRTIGFEARYGPRGLSMPAGGGGRATGGGGARTGASGAGGSATMSGSGGGFGVGKSVRVSGDSIADGLDSRKFDVDLWLVHNAPGQNEEAIQQVLTGVRGSAWFAFAPVTVETAKTSVNLQVTGMLRFATDGAGAMRLIFVTSRNAKFSPATGSARDALPSTQGTSTTTHPMPGPDDVLSFELPPLRVPNGGPAIPDQFSVRLRIR